MCGSRRRHARAVVVSAWVGRSGDMIRIENGPHLDDQSRAMLASGRANASVALFIDTLVEMRGLDDRVGEVAAGVLLEAEAPAEMRADAFARALAAIDRGAGGETSVAPVYPELIRLPAALAEAVRAAEARRGWTSIGYGIRQLKLGEAGGIGAEILRIPPGGAAPKHGHRGREYTLCLIGTFSDSAGEHGPGDVSFADESVTHQPTADRDGGPVFVLAITDGGLRLTGLMGVVQTLLGQ